MTGTIEGKKKTKTTDTIEGGKKSMGKNWVKAHFTLVFKERLMREGCCNRKKEPQGRESGAPKTEGERERHETERESGECVWEK